VRQTKSSVNQTHERSSQALKPAKQTITKQDIGTGVTWYGLSFNQ